MIISQVREKICGGNDRMREIQVNAAIMNRDMNAMQGIYQNLTAKLNDLTAVYEELNGTWQGAAKQEWTASVADSIELMKSQMRAIQEVIDILNFAIRRYDACEDAVAQAVDAVQI
ncbi:MAG: hypothetical protein EOM40_05315 [Clostridia bacterium]|nr:hypothetical protein [Clostridia bacterium]